MSLTMTPSEREAFLADVHVGVISIAEPDRGPLTAPIWYAYEPGGELWILTGRDSRKGRLLETAGAIPGPGPKLVRQTETMAALAAVAGTPIDVAFESDGLTQVDIRREQE